MKPVYTFRVLRLPAYCSIPFRSLATLLILSFVILLNTYSVLGEGTKQVMPTAANGTGLIVSTTSSFPLGNVGAYVPASGLTPVDQRIFIRIKNFSTEKFYYGFNWEFLSPSGTPSAPTYNDVYMNIYDPTGALVTTVHLPTSGAG